MGNKLSDKITIVIGTGITAKGIIETLLSENATVVVPAGSSREVKELKHYLTPLPGGELITFLTDLSDYSKILEIVTTVKGEYGKIDLAVAAPGNFCTQTAFTQATITDWERMMEQYITPFFVSTRIMLSLLENDTSMYITVSESSHFMPGSNDALGQIAAYTQLKMAEITNAELAGIRAGYHHLNIDGTSVTADMAGGCIVQLYLQQAEGEKPAVLAASCSEIKSLSINRGTDEYIKQ